MHRLGMIILFIIVFSLLSTKTTASPSPALPPKIFLATWHIPLMVENEHKGLFIDLVREISRRTKKPIEISVQPVGQALMAFSNKKVHGYFPAHTLSLAKNAMATSAFYTKTDYIFFKKDLPLRTLKDLEGRKVGLTFRYFYDPEILSNKKILFEYADDDFINMKKLGQGLIDAFVVEERSGLKALQESGFTNISFEKDKALSSKSIYFAFENTPQGAALCDLFDQTLAQMKKDGYLDRLFSVKK